MQNIKFLLYAIVAALLISLGIVVILQNRKIKEINSNLSTAVINIKAAEAENDSLINKNIEFNYTIAQLNFSNDSLIKDIDFKLDTVVGDEWAKLKLGLEFPNKIQTEYSFKNETMVFSSSRKETIDPPKKCWLLRLFQKKHIITDVEIIQNNPYCENDIHKHIKIVN